MGILNKVADFFVNLYALYKGFVVGLYEKVLTSGMMKSVNKYEDIFVIIFTVVVLILFILICSLFKKRN